MLHGELKRCPFCGGEAEIKKSERQWHGIIYRIGCLSRGCCGWWFESVMYKTEAEAVEAWNSRAERTCRVLEHDELPYAICSECGAIQPDDFTVYYCWACGARVIA